ncbi:MAG: hypothetical protein CO092_01460 [Candidatus Aenigmarchaeota archaeon CG_4_9_14_3_um_filter_37_18]|nr:MAG: hypothetical protein COW21_00050 [Candidatus Aenigmarchaeota archaeon CG15_BIG_FIL_POST_REV_8_21_14_020_37_27]PJB75588.1 MAG: hypothetical protein CO092_01460 [Candidatus Aenigmarchaeota archaeon CG_4_9_14_3_um_filter_37_18]
MEVKFTQTDARIVKACKMPKRPIELVEQFKFGMSYSYLNQRLSFLAAVGVLEKCNSEGREKNATWYSVVDRKYLEEAERILGEGGDNVKS